MHWFQSIDRARRTKGDQINTTTSQGKLVFGIFVALAEFERDLIFERTKPGLASSLARDRTGGLSFKMTPAKVRLAATSMQYPETKISDLCKELGVTRQMLCRYVSPDEILREYTCCSVASTNTRLLANCD